MSIKRPTILCGEHDEKEAEFYCMDHDKILCTLCVWDHSEHKASVKVCTIKDVKKHNDILKQSLEDMHIGMIKKIATSKERLKIISDKCMPMSANSVSSTIAYVRDLLSKPYLSEE